MLGSSDHECLVVGGAGSAKSTSVTSAGGAGSAGKAGVTCDCIFLTASMLTLVDRFFCRVCSEVFDNLSLNALSAICLETFTSLFIIIMVTGNLWNGSSTK